MWIIHSILRLVLALFQCGPYPVTWHVGAMKFCLFCHSINFSQYSPSHPISTARASTPLKILSFASSLSSFFGGEKRRYLKTQEPKNTTSQPPGEEGRLQRQKGLAVIFESPDPRGRKRRRRTTTRRRRRRRRREWRLPNSFQYTTQRRGEGEVDRRDFQKADIKCHFRKAEKAKLKMVWITILYYYTYKSKVTFFP